MNNATGKKREYFDIFRRVDVGSVIAIGAIGAIGLLIAYPAKAATILALTALYMLLFLTRRPRDEFGLTCWRSSCSAVFIALLIALIVMPFFGGMFDAFTDGYMGTPPKTMTGIKSPYEVQIDQTLEYAPTLSLFAFFVGFQWRRFRGI